MSDTCRVFRLRLSIEYSANGSGGDWRLYDSATDLKRDLIAAYLDVIGSERERTDRKWYAKLWRKHLRGDDETYPRVRSIGSVEQLVDGAWIEITAEFIDPDVLLRGVR